MWAKRRRHIAPAAATYVVPVWCYRAEHPLRTGVKGKLYHRCDFVGPIVDAIIHKHEQLASADDPFDIFQQLRKKRQKAEILDVTEVEKQKLDDARELVRATGVKKKPTTETWQCAGCGTTDKTHQHQTKESLVCKCGAVVRMGGRVIHTHRERLGADEADDATTHADRVRVEANAFDGEAPTADERRQKRALVGKVTNVGASSRLLDAQRRAEQAAAKEQLATRVADGDALSTKEDSKLFKIVGELDAMFRLLAPVDSKIKSTTRRSADRLWKLAARHASSCTRIDCCELRIFHRPTSVVATAVFEIILERIIHGLLVIDSVPRQHVLDLSTRLNRSASHINAGMLTQINGVKAVLSILDTPHFKICTPCAPQAVVATPAPVPVPAPARSRSRRVVTVFARTDSTMSVEGGGSPPLGPTMMLRDAVVQMFLAHESTMPTSVRDGATRAIQDPAFAQACESLRSLHKLGDDQQLAFCVLNAVAREQARDVGPFMAPPGKPGCVMPPGNDGCG